MSGNSSKLTLIAVAFLLLVGASLRWHGLAAESFWVDEVFSNRIIQYPIGEVIAQLPPDKPPLDYYVQWATSRILPGPPELTHRFHSFVFGVLTLAGLYLLSRAVGLRRSLALAVLCLAACNPLLIRYAQEARPYSLFVCLATWQQWIFLRWWQAMGSERRPNVTAWSLGLLCISIAAMYTLYAMVVILAAELLWLLVQYWRAKKTTHQSHARLKSPQALILFIGILACVGVSLLPLRGQVRVDTAMPMMMKFNLVSLKAALDLMGDFFSFGGTAFIHRAGGAIALVLTLLGAIKLLCSDSKIRAGLPLIILASIFPQVLFYWSIDRSLVIRYLIHLVPSMLIVWVVGIEWLAGLVTGKPSLGKSRFAIAIFSAVIISTSAYTTHLFKNRSALRPDWHGVARELTEKNTAADPVVVFAGDGQITLYYYLARVGAPQMPVYRSSEFKDLETQGPAWRVFQTFDHKKAKTLKHYGLRLVAPGTLDDDSKLSDNIGLLDHEGKLWPAQMPVTLLGDGWSPVEYWDKDFGVRWVMRKEVRMLIPIPRAGDGVLTINAMPHTPPTPGPTQTIALRIKGRTYPPQPLPSGQFTSVSWPIEAGMLGEGMNEVTLIFTEISIPAEERENYPDFRTLAAVVQWLQWQPH